jgi:hypothetical protein
VRVDICVGCGQNTSPGTRLFSDRVRIHAQGGEPPLVLCGDCHAAEIQRVGRPLTERELRGRLEGASAIGMFHGPV